MKMRDLLCACAFAYTSCALIASDAPGLLPGYLTDPSAGWKDIVQDGYQTPSHLKYPYIAMHYLKPTLVVGEKQWVGYYVTDFDHSLVRFGDDSRRFDVQLRLTSDRETFKEKWQKDVPSANGKFYLDPLPVGEYSVGIRCIDKANGLSSHTVWHRFRVVEKGALDIAASETRVMTEDDLKAYGLRNDGDYESLHLIEADDPAKRNGGQFHMKNKELAAHYLQIVDDYLAAHPHVSPKGRPGYTVYTAAFKGLPIHRAYERCRVAYDAGYDKAAVAAIAEANSVGLQKFLDDAKAAGKRKAVLLPGVYRVSKDHTLRIPDRFTLDLGGATLKLNGCAGEKALMVKLAVVTDSHLVNGTVEGDYFEHDYKAKESHSSEWVCGWELGSMAEYCSVENVTTRYITGYGGNNGLSLDGPGPVHQGRPFFVRVWNTAISDRKNPMEPGALKADGTVDASDKAQWTGPYRDISAYQEFGALSVSYFLGYQAVRTRGWNYVIAFYDAEKNFLSREVAFQYRDVMVPKKAKYCRVAVEVANEQEAQKNELSIVLFKTPRNCTVTHCRYDRCRAVGHASSHMSNFLFQENEFTQCGECLATCAYDAEDGWDGMQDVLFLKNDFHDNYMNELLTCAGHNFQMIGNKAKISLSARTFSPYVKGNDCASASFGCRQRTRTGYARFVNNTYRGGLALGGDEKGYSGWDVVISDLVFTNANVSTASTGRFRNCTFKGGTIAVANAENCTFENCPTGLMRWRTGRWTDCTAKDCTFTRQWCTNLFVNCTLTGCNFKEALVSTATFVGCDLKGTKLGKPNRGGGYELKDCKNAPVVK